MKRSDRHRKKSQKTPFIIGIILTGIIMIVIGVCIFVMNQKMIGQDELTTENNANQNEEQTKNETNQSEVDGEKINEEATKKESEQQIFDDNGYIEGQPLPNGPTYIKGVLIANKKYPLPKNFNPGENKEARQAFEKMAKDAAKEGIKLTAFSTYRSYDYQKRIYDKYVERDGKDKADRYSARPGYSEHQTGLAFDIGEVGREDLWLKEEFGETKAGKWLVKNAHKYGFILRYPKGKEKITGYMYESWHFRYLGVDLATKVKDSGLTLEEYLGID